MMKQLLKFRFLLIILLSGAGLSCGADRTAETPETFYINDQGELESVLENLRSAPHDAEMLAAVWWYYTRTGMYKEMIAHALPVYDVAKRSNLPALRAQAGIYLAQAYLARNQYDSLEYFVNEVSDIVERLEDDDLTTIRNNILAIHAVQVEMDYAKALHHFNLALESSRRSGKHSNTGLILCNIAYIYYMRQDPSGINFAREAYLLGKEIRDEGLLAAAAMLMAQMHLVAGDHVQALEYATQYSAAAREMPHERGKAIANIILGEIYGAMGHTGKAGGHYSEASRHIDGLDDESTVMRYYLSYGNFLLENRDIVGAEKVFSRGLGISVEKGNIESRHDFLLGLSKAYSELGRNDRALEYYKKYHIHSDSIQTVRREQDFNQLLLSYEKLNHENEIKEKELNLEKATRRTQTLIYLFVLAVIALAGFYVIYKRKDNMYRQLVEKHQKVVSLERNLHSKEVPQGGQDNHSDPEKVLFGRIEELMNNECLYRNHDISLEMLADRLQTNRSYVSKVINTFSGATFYNYVHSHRIREAVKILSDPGNDIPLKALYHDLGYNALSAFYRSFQKETGVPPSKYRDEVRRITRLKKTCPDN